MTNENMQPEQTEEFQEDIVTLVSEDGQEENFLILGDFDFEGKSYAVLCDDLSDEEDMAEETSIIVLQIVDEDGEDVLYEIEDDEEWERVVEHWNSLGDEE